MDLFNPVVLNALRALQVLCPSAILAGGYLRDTILERPVKDIDLFCSELGDDKRLALKALFPDAKPEQFSEWLAYQGNEVVAVWSLGECAGLPLQLIELAPGCSPVDRAKSHDFGICQVWHDGTDADSTEAFYRDCHDRSFTLAHCEDQAQFDRSMRRFERLSKKYPDHELVIPQEFQQWANTTTLL